MPIKLRKRDFGGQGSSFLAVTTQIFEKGEQAQKSQMALMAKALAGLYAVHLRLKTKEHVELPIEMVQIVILHLYFGFSQGDVAALFGCSKSLIIRRMRKWEEIEDSLDQGLLSRVESEIHTLCEDLNRHV